MEELLNKLIEKGWKPRGIYTSIIGGYGLVRCEEYVGSPRNERKSYRELVSNESGLWQFCVENGMRPKRVGYEEHYWQRDNHTNGRGMVMESEPEYRIIESALKDEEDLEKFLLENIKIS